MKPAKLRVSVADGLTEGKGENMKALIEIQKELKAPKGQYNSFGKYKYRSAEDILEAVKPLLHKYGCQLTLSDEIVLIGDRYYVKATATITDGAEVITTNAYAREDLDKKGMDQAQVTGSVSSYARKYCLSGLLLIDDQKDPDTDEYANQQKKGTDKLASPVQLKVLKDFYGERMGEFLKANGYKTEAEITMSKADESIRKITAWKKQKEASNDNNQ